MASDHATALAHLNDSVVALLLVGAGLPDAEALCRRARDLRPQVLIMALTSEGAEDAGTALAELVDARIADPLDLEEFLEVVEIARRERTSRDTLDEQPTAACRPVDRSLLPADPISRPVATRLAGGAPRRQWLGLSAPHARRLEERAAQSDARYRAVLDTSVNAILTLDIFGHVRECNRAGVRLLGVDVLQIIGRSLTEFVHPDDRSRISALLAGSLVDGQSGHVRIRGADGAPVPALLLATRVCQGAARVISVTITDLTEIVAAEEAVAQSEALWRALGENLPDVVALARPDGRIEFGNSGPATESGTTIVGMVLEESVEDLLAAFERAATGGATVSVDLDAFNRAGDVHHSSVRMTPVDRGDGWVLVSITDIHERWEAERALAESQRALAEAQRMESLGTLAGGVAHDFNNILTVVMSCAEFVQEELGPEHASADDVRMILESSERAAKLIDQLLAFSRRNVVSPVALDANEALANVHRLLRRTFGAHIEVVVLQVEEVGHVLIDPVQFEQVLLNLAVNARDAMPDGGTLVIGASAVTRAHDLEPPVGPCVQIEVADTGTGMSPEVRSRIFEPFFTTKPPQHGTGLGLATCLGLVQRAGGRIDCESQEGGGTTFRVVLPVTQVAVAPSTRIGAAAKVAARVRILLAEDESRVRDLVTRVLEQAGHEVVAVSNGEEALRAVVGAEVPFDLVLTDVQMPQMTGDELARRLEAHPNPPLVAFMSGYSHETHVVGFARRRVLLKPFRADDLLEFVDRALRQRSDTVQRDASRVTHA